MFTKGHPGYKKPGTKNRETLLKEERRRIFEEQTTQEWERIIKKLPPTYVADQFMGKAPDKVELTAAVTTHSLTDELLAAAEAELKKHKLHEQQSGASGAA